MAWPCAGSPMLAFPVWVKPSRPIYCRPGPLRSPMLQVYDSQEGTLPPHDKVQG